MANYSMPLVVLCVLMSVLGCPVIAEPIDFPVAGEGEGEGEGEVDVGGEGEGEGDVAGEGEGEGEANPVRRWPLGSSTLQLSDGAAMRDCTILVPNSPLLRLPALLVFHSNAITVDDQLEGLDALGTAQSLGVIIMACEGIDRVLTFEGQSTGIEVPWDPYNIANRDMVLAQAMQTELVLGNADQRRISLFGVLQGGFMAFSLVTDFTSLWSTAIIVNAGDSFDLEDTRAGNIGRPFRFDFIVATNVSGDQILALEVIRATRANLSGEHDVDYLEVDAPLTTTIPVSGVDTPASVFRSHVADAITFSAP